MKKNIILILILVVGSFLLYYIINSQDNIQKQRDEYTSFLNSHKYANNSQLSKDKLEKTLGEDRPDLALQQDFLRTIDPKTKKLHQERLINSIEYAEGIVNFRKLNKISSDIDWESRGPKRVSGRVRALMFDPNDSENKRVFSGGVSGGIWKNEDITAYDSEWTLVYPNMSNFAISAMAYDPVVTTTFYVGTGEGWKNIDSVRGAGIWKSTDGGATWTNLSSTTRFDYVYDIVVRNENAKGVIYAAMQDLDNSADRSTNLYKSIDGGVNWTIVSREPVRDLEVASDNTIWVGDHYGHIFSITTENTFTKKYTSSFNIFATYSRVELATAPSNSDVVYALITNSEEIGEIVKTTDKGTTWTNLSTPADVTDLGIPNDDFTNRLAWYCLIINVNPTDEHEIYVGGINTFKSSDGGTTWEKTSTRSTSRDNSVSYVHADIHNIKFRPNNSNQILIATDGGIFYGSDIAKLPASGFVPRNLKFNVTQFNSGVMDPLSKDIFLGGTQDNGTNYFFEPGLSNTSRILGGDGSLCFIDQTSTNRIRSAYYLASEAFNICYLFDLSEQPNRIVRVINNIKNGSFVNPADYDDENNIYYSYNSNNSITRVMLKPDFEDQIDDKGVFLGTKDIITINELNDSKITHLRTSPYNENERKLYIGTASGRILVLNTKDKTLIPFTAPNIVGSVSCIEFGASEDEILVTYYNYGVKSVWYTSDNGANWTDVEGELPDIPVRWALFNPINRKQVILATEIGVWKTDNIKASPVVWTTKSEGMESVRVDMLQYRKSDSLILAATYGRGLFTSRFSTVKDEPLASVKEAIDEKTFAIYPTISKGNFTLQSIISTGKAKMNIYNINGKLAHTQEVDFNKNEKQEISVRLSSGVYILNLITYKNNKNFSTKIIIE